MTLGIYGTHPDDLGAGDAFPALVEAERASGSLLRSFAKKRGAGSRALRTFEGGMEAFPKAVAAALGSRVRTGVGVAGI